MVQSAEDRQRRISLAVSPWPMTGAFGVVVILLVRTQDMAQVSRGCIRLMRVIRYICSESFSPWMKLIETSAADQKLSCRKSIQSCRGCSKPEFVWKPFYCRL